MTESDHEYALQQAVRQHLLTYAPPCDPRHWQQLDRRLGRARRWRKVRWLGGILLLVISSWYTLCPIAERPPDTSASLPIPRHRLIAPAVVAEAASNTGAGKPLSLRKAKTEPKAAPPARRAPISALKPLALGPMPPPALPLVRPLTGLSPVEADIIRRVGQANMEGDSTSYQALSRNIKQWSKAVIVCDFTSSMYPYATQLLRWFDVNQGNAQVKGLVFFTDCDSLGQETGPGRAGQLYATRHRSVEALLPLMLAAARHTVGNHEDAENDVEALLYAQAQFPEATDLVLVADNSSPVKDLARLAEVHKPVHVILCGANSDTTRAFHPDYYAIARRSGGSLHTLEDDLTNVGALRRNTLIRADGRYYRLNRRGQFKLMPFRHRPARWLGLFWY